MQDRGPLVALGAHLLLHRLLDRRRRVDRLDLHAIDPDAPLAGGVVEDRTQLGVDLLAGGQRTLQVHAADHVAQGRHGELVDGLQIVRHLVDRGTRIGDLVVEHRVDVDHQVVLGDDRLWWGGEDLLADVQSAVDPVGQRDDEVQPRLEGRPVTPEALDDVATRLRDHPHRAEDEEDHQDRRDEDRDQYDVHRCSPPLRMGSGE
ncbi:hypothetical protein SDC9_159698 [bioreactor metagenome]|uniref:Uncharacterized protein n=1 Tax=bioreactor metagenome TaxID=1076179 RepID=A0A645FEI1_9ZZZZ